MSIKVLAERRQDDAKAKAAVDNASQPVESGAEQLHTWWELSYAAYFVMPRSLMQSMPDDWQRRMAALLDEGHEIVQKHGIEWPPKDHSITVQLRHPSGHFVSDDLADYQRGRRRLWRNEDSTSSGSERLQTEKSDET